MYLFIDFSFHTMNSATYTSSCPTLQSNLSLHSSSYYSEYGNTTQRRRLSSTGEADTSATSSYEGSEGSSENNDENRLEPVTQLEREQLETFFRGLKSQVIIYLFFAPFGPRARSQIFTRQKLYQFIAFISEK